MKRSCLLITFFSLFVFPTQADDFAVSKRVIGVDHPANSIGVDSLPEDRPVHAMEPAALAALPTIDCSLRRILYVNDDIGEIDKSDNTYVGNFYPTFGGACGSTTYTMKQPRKPGCPWVMVQMKQCPNGKRNIFQMEFGISEAHSKLLPIQYIGNCGMGGKEVWLQNSDAARTVEFTVEVSSASVPAKQSSHTVLPGDSFNLGCTFVSGDTVNYFLVDAKFK